MSEKINNSKDLINMLKPIERLLGYKDEMHRVFRSNGDRVIIPAYKIMKQQLKAHADEKPVNVSGKDAQIIRRAGEVMVDVVTSGSITQFYRNLAEKYLSVMSNWNIQLGKNRSLDTLIKACNRILMDRMTMKDTSEVMVRVRGKLQQLLRYNPPAFELSRHYLKTLQEDIEKDKTECPSE